MPVPTKVVTAAVLVIGNEILTGRTRDANVQYIARGLGEQGIRLREARVVPDEEEVIIAALNALRAAHDYVFTTGGIGSTHDDITAQSVARAFGRRLVRDPEAVRRLEAHYGPEELTEARLLMARVPEGAALLDNPVSAAPGFRVENVFVLPGIPRIMQAIFDGLRPSLEGGTPMQSRSIAIYVPESELAPGLSALQARHASVDVGSYPFFRHDRVGSVVVVRGTDPDAVDRAAAEVRDLARSLGVEPQEDDTESSGERGSL